MVINSNIIVSSKAPMRYFTQSGVVDSAEAGGAGARAGAGSGVGGGVTISSGGEAVIKAPTALQPL